MLEGNNALEQMPGADMYKSDVYQGFAETRLATERAVGGAIERVFERYANAVQCNEETGAETLTLYKEWKLGEWADVAVTRHTSDSVRTTTLSFWASSSNGWGSAIRYVEAAGDAEASWQSGRLVACRIVVDPETRERTVVETEKPTAPRMLDPTSDMHVAHAGRTWVDTLSKSYIDTSQGDLVRIFRARGMRFIDERKEQIKPVVERIEQAHPVAIERVEKVAKKVGKVAAQAATKVRKVRAHRKKHGKNQD